MSTVRLFTAITLGEQAKSQLAGTVRGLQACAVRGNFTRAENLHLTLVFIGETERLDAAKRAVRAVPVQPFTLHLEGVSKFDRRDGDIWWVGTRESAPLQAAYAAMCGALRAAGFAIEQRPYTPHLTLGRRVKMEDGFDAAAFARQVPPLDVPVARISLMESARVNGVLTYTER